ncbi:uncharacterized protein LOC121594376 isoform X1 [Anopheles merus]|uniref:uncharacterized protein LOC121594376 isoform X1 n=1 Tax=Anopheles merus TaxID=30066 RepID=UPI001BE423F0|nr:uncharacterized protein LOC121594376 isoform X1 [Anopheles merus]XP_041773488.1 uncharacterized protein LOC121594376 isoform X1 [Anopheles merus]XP_041773489.1 uncharacterized protein LOC121594376 isoform X1 [Anopheles merus]
MESSQAATVSAPATVADPSTETSTASTATAPSAAVNSQSPDATPVAACTPAVEKEAPVAATTNNPEQSEPKIEQVTPADMETETSPSPVSTQQEAVDPLAVPEESPEISTTSVEGEKSAAESTLNEPKQAVVEKNPPASNDGAMADPLAKPSTSSNDPAKDEVCSKESSSELSESLPTSTSSPGGDPTLSSSNVVEEETSARRSPPVRTPPPVVESSTASPEKLSSPAVSDSRVPLKGSAYSTSSTVDSSSSDKPGDSNADTAEERPSSNCKGSDSVNSINSDCSSNSNEAESQATATDGGSKSQEANTTTSAAPNERIRSPPSSEIAVPTTAEVTSNAVIGKESRPEGNVDPSANGVVIEGRPEPGKGAKESEEGCEKKPNTAAMDVSGREQTSEKSSSSASDGQTSEESQAAANSKGVKEAREGTVLECRESAAVPPEPDPGPPVAEESKSAEGCKTLQAIDTANSNSSKVEHHSLMQASQNTVAAVESSPREDKTSDNSDSSRTMGSLNTGAPSRPDYHQPQQQQPPVSARNPLQFTEVANDEVELKVDGGHLLDRVIKLSLLKGLQDSGKRLAKSSLIISGAGASVGEGANGEATLATTSSLSKAKSAAAGLRLMEEHKTTPPALVANGGVGGSGDGAQVPVKEPASSTKEVADSPQQTPSGGRIRHSSETTVSSSPSGELDGGVRSSSSNSSLDFREEERSGPTQEVASPASSSLEASSSRSSGSGRDSSVAPNSNDGHLPVKARKPQYYASLPDFSKQQFASSTSTSTSSSSSSSSVPTSTTTATKSLTQLHMKTPDFSCLASGTASSVPSSQTSPSSTTTNSTISTAASMNVRTTSELKISNPDFTKGFAAQHAHYGAHGNYPPTSSYEQQQQPGNSSSPYVSQDTFSKLIKERNYIADLQLKNPPPSQGPPEGPVVVKGASSQNEYPPSSRGVVVDATSSSSSSSAVAGTGASSYGHAPQASNNQYRRSTSGTENGVEQEPKAHVIHKSVAPLPPPSASSQPIGGHHAPKTWNPPEFSSKHFTQAPPAASHNRPSSGANGSGPSSTSPSSRDPSPAPSSSSPHQPPYGPAGGLVNYAGKAPHAGPTSVVGTERIIVNNVRTYYPEASVPPSAASAPNASAHAHPASPYTSLPKVKDPEFRLDHNKEQLLLQEGTIVTVKQPYPNHTTGRGPIPGPHAPPSTTRSPSVERREAQMMQNSQDILYRDYKQHKKPTSSGTVGMSSSGNSTRPPGPAGGQMDRRSPYDSAAYYAHQHRPPVVPPQAGGLMHPPPPNWPAPGPGQHHPSHQLQRGPAAPGARNSPQDMGASPVSSPAPPPPTSQQQHHYQQHQGAYYGQYKNAPSPVSGSTYGSSSSPSQPQGAGGKYPPQQQHYAGGGSGTTPDRRHEVLDRGVGPGNYKGLDYNMEQKFAEVYQAHQAKEKQAAAEAAHAAASNPSARQQGPRHGPAAGAGGSPGTSSTPGGPPTKGPAPYGPTGYEQYHPYYQHSQATPSPTSTPSPVPSPHHRKYSGPPSRDPSPLGQQPQQPPPPHHRYGSSEPLYHIPPGAGPPTMYMHSGPPKPNEQGVPTQGVPPGPVTSYYQGQPSSSSSYSSAGYPNRPHHAGGVVSPSQHHNSSQQSVISGNSPYDRYAHPYTTGGPPQPTPGGQVQQQPHQQQQSYQAKPSLPYPPAGRQQGPPPLQPTPPSAGAAPSAVIHPPVAGSKNIPVRVIATAPPASSSATASSAGSNTVPTAQQHGPARSTGQSSASSSSAPVPPSQAALAAGEGSGSTQRDLNATVVATTPVIIAPKRESPLDLSVKTVKTKADSTGCDDYATSASNSSISSSSSNSSVGNGRPREVVPKVDFSPNFQKHIPPRGAPGPNFAQSSAGPPALGGRPPEPHLPPRPTPSPTRHVSVISPAIPPGYDKKTDAYLSANYRAVGGPLTTPAYQYPPSRSGPMPPGAYEGSSSSAGSGSSVASASSKSVYYPPAGPEYGRPGGKSGSGSIVTGQAAPLPAGASNSRSNPPPHGAAMVGQPSGASQPRMDDPRIEDRKFVESMLKKKTSPSSDVMADLQAGKFPTRIPQGLVPKKRAAAAAAAAAAAEAALTKQGPVPPGSNSPATAPTPAKVAKYEDPQTSRSQAPPPQGSTHASAQGAPTFDGRYGPSREGPYPSYGPPGHHYGPPAGKRPSPPEMSNGPPAVHPSVITTNYHHHPQAILQQHHQQQQQQQQQYDARYYQHHAAGIPPKARDDHVMPVYHQPHLRGGSAAAPYTAHGYGGYAKEEPNAPPHPPYPPHPHSDPAAYHKESQSFRYGESLKPPQEHTAAVHHMQSHIHYTGGGAGGAMAKVPHQMPPHQQQQQQLHHHQQQQSHSQAPHHLPSSQSTVAPDAPMGVTQYPPSVHPSYGLAQHHRGADQSVISKLRTSLEQKEYEKQRINQLRKQPPGVEQPTEEDRSNKTSIASASPVAASIVPTMHEIPSPSSRFRTKGELKGYTPLPTPSVVSMAPARSIDDPAQLKKDGQEGAGGEETSDDKKRSIVPPADLDGASALDILDWGSACNEFVEQLQTGKKRGRRKRAAGTTASAASTSGRGWPAIDSLEPTVPLADGASTDLSAIPKEVLNSARSPHRLKGDRNGSESSSDEDKPLLLLRQQSQQQKEQDGKGPVPSEKVARNHRERQRFELEQKHEAKLGRSSSTDSETARVASAAAQRAKARVRKLRHRSSVAPTLSLKSSDGDGDVTADGGEEDGGKPGSKRRPHALAPNAKRKRTRGPGSRSPSSSAASSSCGESSEPGTKKSAGNEGPKKRGRPKGTRAPGSKRGQQSSNSRCQSGAIKQEPNENSDLSSDDEPRAVRTPHKNGSSAANNDSARKRGDATGAGGGGGAGGPSGGGGNAGGKAQHGHKVNESAACNGGQKDKSAGAKKKFVKTRTNSRSKAELSSDSSSSSSGSSSSEEEEEEEEEAEETMTRSRSKREAERRRSNSKVLRNDKIVENCPNPGQNQRAAGTRNRVDSERTPSKKAKKERKLSAGEPTTKRSKSRVVESDSDGGKAAESSAAVPRKRTRQASKNAPNSSAGSGESANSSSEGEEGQADMAERLRSRKVAKRLPVDGQPASRRQSTASATKGGSRRASTTSTASSARKKGASGASSSSAVAGMKKSLKELNQQTAAATAEAPDHFYPGWEKELYEYKRSLKVPPELITIDGGLYMHRISTSLPDLDSPHHSDGSETFSEIVKKLSQRDIGSAPPKRFKTKAAAKQQQQQQQPLPGTSSFASTPPVRVKEEEQTRQERKKLDDNEKFSSIIELLHRRCLAAQAAKPTVSSSSARGKGAKGAGKGANSNNTSSSESTKPKQEYELLPTPGAESESLFSKNSKKKKSLFDTAILKSRTRTEQKAMQSKEMIREVFGGDGERPQSAPPLSCDPEPPPLFEEGLQNVTYDEKYNELMRNVDRIVGELDGGAVTAATTPTPATVKVKQEPPEEEEEEEEEDDEDDDDTQDGSVRMKDSERDTPSIASERGERELPGTPLSFNGGAAIANGNGANGVTTTAGQLTVPPAPKKRGRGHRTSRRKGSSGFDYIRKKKKPSQQHSQGNHGNQQHGASGVNGVNGAVSVRKVTAFENMEGKDETHISKEIRSWVLNKGVGESVMHKAARLGYTDVIVYCLERLDMDPDLKDNAGYTPLHEACAKGHLDIANYLLQYGASHSEPAPSGMRPLHEAVENSFVEIVRLLLAFGADPMLATYAGMTPIQLAESDDMTLFLEHHLKDVQSMAPNKTGWKFDGPWKIHVNLTVDPEESGCNVFSDIPGFEEADSGLTTSLLNTSGTSSSGALSSTSSKQCDSNSNIMHYEVGESATTTTTTTNNNNNSTTTDTDGGPARKRNGITAIAAATLPAGLRNGKIKRELPKQESEQCRLPNGAVESRPKLVNGQVRKDGEQPHLELHDAGSEDSEGVGEINFEYEESDRPLPPLYVLKDEYNERWMLMSDLCTFLKFKSKEAVLRQICPNNSPTNQRELIREMKIEEFLTRANCLQLLCAGEKLNIHASKVVLVKYNDSVKSLLQVQSYATRI